MECKYRYLIYLSAVHDKANAVYGDRRLGDVGRHDALAHAIGRVVENLVLVLERKCAVQGQHNPLGVSLGVLLARIGHRRDFAQSAHEDEKVAALIGGVLFVDKLQNADVGRRV